MKFCSIHHFLIRPQLLLHPGLYGLSPTLRHGMPSPRRKKGLQVHGEGKLKRKLLILPTQLRGRAQTSHRGRTSLVHPNWLWNLVTWSLLACSYFCVLQGCYPLTLLKREKGNTQKCAQPVMFSITHWTKFACKPYLDICKFIVKLPLKRKIAVLRGKWVVSCQPCRHAAHRCLRSSPSIPQ